MRVRLRKDTVLGEQTVPAGTVFEVVTLKTQTEPQVHGYVVRSAEFGITGSFLYAHEVDPIR